MTSSKTLENFALVERCNMIDSRVAQMDAAIDIDIDTNVSMQINIDMRTHPTACPL